MKTWLGVAEKGSLFGIRFFFFACTVFGRGVARFFLKVVVLYYVLFHAKTRRASYDYLRRATGRKPTFWMAWRHMLTFGEVSVDRVFFLQDKFANKMQVGSHGFEHMRKLNEEKRGAILLGAHLGSFEAMHVLAAHKDVRINILAYRGNSRMMNQVLGAINPDLNARFIEINPGDVNTILRVKELIEAGEMVAVMGDRADLDTNVAGVEFFGSEAYFPTSLYLLSAAMACPILLTVCLYRTPNRYDVYCERFADKVSLPREDRKAALAVYAQRYASRLEHYCRLAPYSWLNFYDFWSARS
jgi:predicted LPLAT superfamily acyltransferase